jgi:hypothetical protein
VAKIAGRSANFAKMAWHADQAERTQAKIEAFEAEAAEKGAAQQQGRMALDDGSHVDEKYMGKTLLRDLYPYQRLLGIRDAHQAMVSMYGTLLGAGHTETGHVRGTDGRLWIRDG